jgi:hypothetical protein
MKLAISCCVISIVAVGAFAQQPRISNAQMQTRSAGSGLEAAFNAIVSAQTAPAWVGYAVPIIPGDRQMCCWQNNAMCGCSLEPNNGVDAGSTITNNQTVKLEGPTHLVILFRIENREVGKIRTFTPECSIDAGGLPFVWLTDVKPPESVKLLESLARQDANGRRDMARRNDGAVMSIAMHADPAAERALEDLVSPNEAEPVRRQAVFWLGTARGHRGFEILSRVVREDPSDKIREHAVFSLTQSKDPEALTPVIRAAHEDKSPHVRGQALFWLAQRAGAKVAESAIGDAIANDPETEVKKKAVFALTQIPHDEGVPLLIQVAKTNHNPAVRKQAMFWLGQSKDPRALSFFEEVLK